MRSKTSKQYREQLAMLPEPVRRQAQAAYQIFRENPSHPSLRFKPVSQSDPTMFSVRVGLRYRALGIREADYVLWVWIGSHTEYDRVINPF